MPDRAGAIHWSAPPVIRDLEEGPQAATRSELWAMEDRVRAMEQRLQAAAVVLSGGSGSRSPSKVTPAQSSVAPAASPNNLCPTSLRPGPAGYIKDFDMPPQPKFLPTEATDAHSEEPPPSGGGGGGSALSVTCAHFKVKSWKAEKTILDHVTFSAPGGELLALMGPSGAGKTTLMEFMTLSLKGGVVEGQLRLGDQPLTLEVFKKRVSYVEQYDSHWAFLTCREVLQYAALLFITGGAAERDARVERTMASMGLQECAGTRCGNEFLKGLSGGQKKRLALGIALLKDPSVLLLDEPTSGLDAAAAASVMSYLTELSHKARKIVIATIHQPSTQVFMSFSKVLFLANGRMAYHGRPSKVEEYCSSISRPLPRHTNPADHFIQLINSEFAGRDQVNQVVLAWVAQCRPAQPTAPHECPVAWEPEGASQQRPGFFSQCRALLSRHAMLSFRDPTLYTGRTVAFLFGNAFFSVIYIEARERLQEYAIPRMFLVNWMFAIVTLFSAIAVFTSNLEYKMVRREMKNGMTSATSYLLATTLLPVPYMLMMSAGALVVPLYLIGNGNLDGMWRSILVLAITLWSYESSAQFLAVVADNPLIGALGSINLWVTSFLFCGLFLKPEFVVWPFRVFNSLFPLRWTMRAMQYLDLHGTEWGGAVSSPHGAGDPRGFHCPAYSPIQCYGRTGDQVLDSLSSNFPVKSEDTVALDMVYIAAFGLFWKLLQVIVVVLKARYSFRAPTPQRGGDRDSAKSLS